MKYNIFLLRQEYNLDQKSMANILNITRTQLILIENLRMEIELDESILFQIKQSAKVIVEHTEEQSDLDDIVATYRRRNRVTTRPEDEMIAFVDNYLKDYPADCKVNEDNMHGRSRNIVGRRLVHTRELLNISIEVMAHKLNMREVTYLNHESGRNRNYPSVIKQMSIILNLPEIVLNERLISLEQDLLINKLRQRNNQLQR